MQKNEEVVRERWRVVSGIDLFREREEGFRAFVEVSRLDFQQFDRRVVLRMHTLSRRSLPGRVGCTVRGSHRDLFQATESRVFQRLVEHESQSWRCIERIAVSAHVEMPAPTRTMMFLTVGSSVA